MARQLRSEVAYNEASDELSRSLAQLREVESLLKLGSEASNSHTKASADLLDRLTPAVEGLLRAARGQGVVPADPSELLPPVSDGGVALAPPRSTKTPEGNNGLIDPFGPQPAAPPTVPAPRKPRRAPAGAGGKSSSNDQLIPFPNP